MEKLATGPSRYPVFGHLPSFLLDRLGFLIKCGKYGDVVKLYLGGDTYLLTTPEDIKHVLMTNTDNYDKSPRLTSPKGKRQSGAGLLTSLGTTHLRQRRMLQPVFYRKTIESFADTITSQTDRMLDGWESGSTVNVAHDLMVLAQRNIIMTLFGLEFDDDSGRLAQAILARRRYLEHIFFALFPFPEYLPVRPVREYRQAMKHIDDTIYRAITERRRNPAAPQDFLTLLMNAKYEDGAGMTDQQIREEALVLLITGYETIGEALAWSCYLLAQHPEATTRLLAELRDALDGRRPGSDDLPKLRYTAMVLAESMRLYPPTWIFVRIARHDDTLPSGVKIPTGAKLYLCQYVVHRHPRYFPDPDRFDPLRFSEAAKKERPQFAYFPFGGGPRVCIGESFAKMEGILVLASILQRFRLSLVPGQTIEPEPKMTLRPKNGILMRVETCNSLPLSA